MTSDLFPSHQITIGGRVMAVRLVRNARARRWSLRYDARADQLRLSLPPRGAARAALAWAAEQEAWLARVLASRPPPTRLLPGQVIPYRGQDHRIAWEAGRPRRVEPVDGQLRVGGDAAGVERRLAGWLRQQARATLTEETILFACKLGRPVRGVSVGDPRSRWGSCSSSGAIRYSWRLIMAPPEVLTATVAHEVAHLAHMHHGPEFHALVADILGREPRPERDWLRAHGARLHAVGA